MKMLASLISAGILWTASVSAGGLTVSIPRSGPAIGSEIARGSSAARICGLPGGRGPAIFSACIDRIIFAAPNTVGGSAAFELGVNYAAFRIIDVTLEVYRRSSPQSRTAEDLATFGAADFADIQRLQRDLGLTDAQVCEAASPGTCQDIPELLSRWR
jgi:hypothetical protein